MAEPSTAGTPSGARDTVYRRPPAKPQADPPWFGATAEPGAGEEPSRVSFGFTSGPISPVRHPASPTSPAAPAGTDLPVRRADTGEQPRPAPAGEQPFAGPAAQSFAESTGGPRGFPDSTGEQRRPADSTGGQRPFADMVGEPRGFPDMTGEQRRVSDTGEFRRFLEADEQRDVPRAAERRVVVPEPPRQSRAVTVGIVLLGLVVLVAGGVVGVTYFTGSQDKLDSVLQLGAGEPADRAVTAPLDNRSQASLELLAATNRVTITIGELGDDLYRISTPEDAGIRPDPVISQDAVKVQVTKDGDGTGGQIDIVLAAKVRWALRLSGYAEEQVVDLRGGQVTGIEMVGGMRTAQLTLARPAGTVPIKVNGAVEKLVVTSPTGNPVRVKVGGGARTVVAGSRTLKEVPPGSTLTPKNWAVQDRYDIGAGAPITSLTVENS
ncbi:hypothetical protein [Actinoplanes sp. URMC 104]|uniref:hypothetical protein n=1 Tax=Actinoplanes sp. URMC 104 TaxID=3423409 RepID=UPI003F1BDD2D